MSETKIALMIALLAVILDQIVHYYFGLPHTFSTLPKIDTIYYIGLKFLFVAGISWYIVRRGGHIFFDSLAIGLISAGLFSLVILFMFPTQYKYWVHLWHIGVAFLASYMIILWSVRR